MKRILYLLTATLGIFAISCKKDSFITGPSASISLSADTLHYDTVFTTTGSVTKVFKIINTNDQKLKLDEIALKGGSNSFFKINADGFKGPVISNLEMEANDSIYVFATVSVNPTALSLPFVVRDSIQISFNGKKQLVQLEAYGQNAHFLRSQVITGNVIWPADLPYVILGGIYISENASLTILNGARVYFHSNAPMIVDGTLVTGGDASAGVQFQGDRLDDPYSGYPGSWPGIFFRETSKNNMLNYAIVKNAYQGLIAEGPSPSANAKLTLNSCLLDNIYDAGLLGIRTSITATNCLISNSGGEAANNLSLIYGGRYDFTHCTIAGYGNSYVTHKNPVLFLSNYLISNNIKYPLDLTARFRNCIFWGENGNVDDEVVVSKEGATVFAVEFTNCLYKIKNTIANATLSGNLQNLAPDFDSTDGSKRFYNFRLKASSPAINKGINTGTTSDLDGKPRTVNPDIGAYERQ